MSVSKENAAIKAAAVSPPSCLSAEYIAPDETKKMMVDSLILLSFFFGLAVKDIFMFCNEYSSHQR